MYNKQYTPERITALKPNDIFEEVLEVFYNGTYCRKTLDYM